MMTKKRNKKPKKKNYKRRSKNYKRAGDATLFVGTVGSFFAYEMAIDFANFKNEVENFIVIQEESFKLNLLIALPALISLLVFALVYRKKNSKSLEGKVAFSLFIALVFLWMIYSIIEVVLFSVMGAFGGSLIDEMLFTPLSKGARLKFEDDHEVDLEVRREKARRKVREDFDGSV